MTRVCPHVRDEFGGSLEECVGADTACLGGGDVDELTGGFAAEWTEEEGVWVEWGMIRWRVVTRVGKVGRMDVKTFTDGSATRAGFGMDDCLPHQFTASSPDPKRGKARSELYIRDAALARFET